MKKALLFLILNLFHIYSFSQIETKTDFNFGFEKISKPGQLPDKLINWSTPAYKLKIDSVVKHSGKNSLLIELVGDKTAQSFGSGAYSNPGNYEGNQIELQAYMKFENVANGSVGLMLRIDGVGSTLQFDNMLNKNIQGTSDWALYSVKLPLPENAKTIFVGAILSGTGKLWVDDFQLLIDGKDISKAKSKILKVIPADKDTEFDKGSGITSINLTPSKIEDLAVLGKVWGFLKYYHPAIANGDYNWDYELFRILPKILQVEGKDERNEVLFSWVLKLGEVKKGNPESIDESLIKLKPDLAWITDNSKLGEKLVNQLLLIRDTKHTSKHYYVDSNQNVNNPQFTNEKPYNGIALKNDAGVRLLALFRYWNIIQYYFPYKYLIDEDWNDVLPEYIPKLVNVTSDLEYKLSVLSLIARVHDTHANIWGNDPVLQNYKGVFYAPVTLKFIENKAVVTGYNEKYSGDKSGLQKGDIILSINKKSIDLILKEKLPITPASNYPTQLRDIAKDLLRSNDTLSEITYTRGSLESSLKLKLMSSGEAGLVSGSTRDTCFKLLTPEIAYIFPGTIKNVYLPEIMKEVKKTRGLIIDMRTYPSEFIVFSLGAYFMPESTDFVKFSKMNITSPGLFTYSSPLKVGARNNDYYKGRIVIIINELTQSQAEYTTMAFRVAPNVKVIGSTTAGADGNVSQFNLPGGISTMISGIGVYYPDGKETQRVGIIPDIEVKPTIKGIIDGRDELLEKAIEIINQK
jgi:hypothetical protein